VYVEENEREKEREFYRYINLEILWIK